MTEENTRKTEGQKPAKRDKGRLFLIPSPLGDTAPEEVIPQGTLALLPAIHKYVVEELRTARRYLSAAGLKGQIDGIEMYELNEHSTQEDAIRLLSLFDEGNDVGLISEAGLPAVADPGASLVALCHTHGIEVVPKTGPSSLMMALMASGLNGQSFAFCGYLPSKSGERCQAIRSIEKESKAMLRTMLFIETPYRNDTMLEDILGTCSEDTLLCIAANITAEDEYISTRTIAEWISEKDFRIGKRPCVFALYAGHSSNTASGSRQSHSSKKSRHTGR